MVLTMLLAESPSLPFWRDPVVLTTFFSSIIATVVGVLITIWYTERQSCRRFVYAVDSDVPVLRKEASDQMKVIFSGKEIQEPRLLVVDLWNAGKVSIDPTDFIEPVAFSFTKQTDVLDAEVLESEPFNLSAVLRLTQSDVILQPLLFNKGDRVRIRILVSGLGGQLKVVSRIKGVRDVVDYRQMKRGRDKLSFILAMLFLLLSIVSLTVMLVYSPLTYIILRYRLLNMSFVFLAILDLCYIGGFILFAFFVFGRLKMRLRSN